MTNNVDKFLAVVCVLALVFSIAFFSFAEMEGKTGSESLTATRGYTNGGVAGNINAEVLHDLLNDDNTSNDPFILSIRKSEHYALGHIPGAINIPLNTLFTEDSLAKLPKNRQIVVYCYTGHTASQATALLNVNGYDAVCLTWGMCSWTTNSTVTVNKYYNKTTACLNYSVCSGTGSGSLGFIATTSPGAANVLGGVIRSISFCGGDTEPAPDSGSGTGGSSTTESGALREATYVSLNQGKSAVIKATVLYENLDDNDTTNDPFILSVRKSEHYELGHICGAVNIGVADLFTEENLQKLPTDKDQQIVVVCYTGHTASQATALLNLNGYNATALMWGMCSWASNSTVTANKCYNKTTDCHDYSFSTGTWDEDLRETIYDSLNMGKSPVIKASNLYDSLNDDNTSNDPFILSICKSEHYALGHIPGAINIPLSRLFTEENLSKLPSDEQIVMVCYTGHTASQATALINAIGYDAIALKWGMCGWCSNSTIAPYCYEKTASSINYPVCSGTEPGTMDDAKLATPDT